VLRGPERGKGPGAPPSGVLKPHSAVVHRAPESSTAICYNRPAEWSSAGAEPGACERARAWKRPAFHAQGVPSSARCEVTAGEATIHLLPRPGASEEDSSAAEKISRGFIERLAAACPEVSRACVLKVAKPPTMEGSAAWALLVCLWLLALSGASREDKVDIFDLAYNGDGELQLPSSKACLPS